MRWIRAAGATLTLLALLVSPPWALVQFIGNPWPAEGVSLSAPFTDAAIIGLLAAAVWVLWAQLVVCVVVETIAVLSADRIQLYAPLTLGVQQQLARRLVTAIVVATVSTPIALGGAATAATEHAPLATAGTTTHVAEDAQHDGQHDGQHDHSHGQERLRAGDRQDRPSDHTDRGQPPGDAPGDHAGREQPTVTVMRLDTLMGIADRVLGDEDRWEEIATINEGRVMNDGAVFRSVDYIRPGWELRLPAEAAPDDEARPGSRHVVESGDTLSAIAQDRLGDADRYPEIFQASRGITQPGGEHLVDPDHIEPGWVVQFPGRHNGPAPQQKEPPENRDVPGEQDQEPPAGTGEEPGQPEATPQQPPSETTPEATVPATPDMAYEDAGEDQVVDEDSWPVRTLSGVCALLAGALIGLIALRRSRQRRQRRPGQQMPLPGGDAEQAEREVRAVADEIGVGVVDVALRALAAHCDQTGQPRPQLRAARLTSDQLDIYLADPAQLSDPWVATEDPTVWVLSADQVPLLEEAAAVSAPYPALVSVGHDVEEGVILLNLDHLGSLDLTGPEPLGFEALTALALELGTAPWAEDLALTVIGSLAELGDTLDPSRLRYVPTPGAVRPAVDGKTHVVLATTPLDETQHRKLRGLRAAVVATNRAVDEWRLDLADRDHGTIQPLGLEIRPQLVDQRTYHGLLEVLVTSQADPNEGSTNQPGSGWVEHAVPFDPAPPAPETSPMVHEHAAHAGEVDKSEVDGSGPVESQVDPAASADELQQQTSADAAVAEHDGDEAKTPAPVDERDDETPRVPAEETTAQTAVRKPVPNGKRTKAHPVDVAEHRLLAAVPDPHPLLQTGHPVIRLLGPVVDVTGATTAVPTSESHQKVCTRLATYLALHPDTSRPALTEAVWGGQRISRGTVDSRISNLRQWLGSDPETGQAYLPPRTLRFTETVTTDWHVFTGLVGEDPTAASTSALQEALSLVRGRPLEGEESKHYGFAEYALEGIVAALVDAAYELARRRYMDLKWAQAGQAAALGVRLDPGNERLWRLRIHAAHSAGNPRQVAEAIERMHARISELGFDLEPETTELLQALDQRATNTIEQSREAL